MSTQSMPPVPPRPTRVLEKPAEMPKIPPRPSNRRFNRSPSPGHGSFAPSPLNEGYIGKPELQVPRHPEPLELDVPPRPPSVTLPSIGQEGNEYGEIFTDASSDLASSPEQTRSVANDLHLHAPKPSLPTSSAKQRVSAVTRTDSGQVAALGLGTSSSPSSEDVAKPSSTSQHGDRPASIIDEEQGIPEIGIQVPMYPNAGDVQAPSPAPSAQFPAGIGFHNDGSRSYTHSRKGSSTRGFEGPPGSYGLHGHGIIPANKLEQAYYEKHPELKSKEAGYSPAIGEGRAYAMSSDLLNKIVRDTANSGSGVGSAQYIGTPDQEIAFQATEEYASRITSPQPVHSKSQSSSSQTPADLSLHIKSASGSSTKVDAGATLGRSLRDSSEVAVDSEMEDDEVIHVRSSSSRPRSRVDFMLESAEDVESADYDESEYSAPILAPDEVAKEPFGYELQPAVSPMHERQSGYHRTNSQSGSRPSSRPSSRPGSIHGGVSGGLNMSTPLEGVEEYEPLFPEEKDGKAAEDKPITHADLVKRPELKNRRFPSRDIWEDTPNSLQYTATVSTPQLPEDAETEQRRRETSTEEVASASASALQTPDQDDETRVKQHRFPSKDVWEDSPDSHQLQATVSTPQGEEKEGEAAEPEDASPVSAAPQIPTRPDRTHALVPERPAKTEKPSIPERAKPQIPARPVRASNSTAAEAAATKPKPQVPSRPLGSKIAALQNGFMSDLNKRLQLGPQAPKKEEPVADEPEAPQEKAPLSDARKSRARGPARRAPAKSPAPATGAAPAAAGTPSAPILSFSSPMTLWHISPEEGVVSLPSSPEENTPEDSPQTLSSEEAPLTGEDPQHGSAQPAEPTDPAVVEAEAVKAERLEKSPEAVAPPAVPADIHDEIEETTSTAMDESASVPAQESLDS